MPVDNRALVALGEALWGAQWQAPMARALGVHRDTVQDWRQDRVSPRAGVYDDLLQVAADRAVALTEAIRRLETEGHIISTGNKPSRGTLIADMCGPIENEAIAADARLITAAPDLLAIAQRWAALDAGSWHAERHAIEKRELMEATKAAIAKAETRSSPTPNAATAGGA